VVLSLTFTRHSSLRQPRRLSERRQLWLMLVSSLKRCCIRHQTDQWACVGHIYELNSYKKAYPISYSKSLFIIKYAIITNDCYGLNAWKGPYHCIKGLLEGPLGLSDRS
jgi:hypothetical protein